jgi:hypothetical protein
MTNSTTSRRGGTTRLGGDPVYGDDQDAASFSRTLIVGVSYGLVAWFHLVLCPAYVLAGLLTADALAGYPVDGTFWALTFVVTGGLMVAVAVGLVAERPLAWRIAPWCVVPNLVAHLAFIAVLPLWGATAIACDVLVLWLVVGERRRMRVSADRKIRPNVARGRARTTRHPPQTFGNRRPT